MSQLHAAAGSDRLPWLHDEPAAVEPGVRHTGYRELAGWAVAGALALAGASYWIGAHSGSQPARVPESKPVTVIEPRALETQATQPQVIFVPQPQVAPVQTREVIVTRPPVEQRSAEPRSAPSPAETTTKLEAAPSIAASPPATPAPVAARPAPVANAPLTLWPAWQSQGAAGRLVRIGAFGTRQQAKLGWRYMVRAYPAVAHLKATVVESRNSRGRPFYRFQIGTTSQAHSEVLCQRIERVHLSCAVVGLPWKPKGVER